jgi:large-conductance mechanosensitive channel
MRHRTSVGRVDFSNLFTTYRVLHTLLWLMQKQPAQATIIYGYFLTRSSIFLSFSLAIFICSKWDNKLQKPKPADVDTNECPHSAQPSHQATAVPNCTSELKYRHPFNL